MPVKWEKTDFTGVRYYKSDKKRHGIKKDKYFAIRYQRDGKRKEEGLGWSSGGWNAEKAALQLAELKNAHTTGKGETRLSEKRAKTKQLKKQQTVENITFSEIFTDHYYPVAMAEKDPQTYGREKSLFKKWIKPVVGDLALKKIAPIHLERIKKNMKVAGLKDRTIEYALAVVRQLFNFGFNNDIFNGDNPVKKVKVPKSDNERKRFFTREEADLLLAALKAEAPELWEIALISLHTGLRAGQILKLRWINIKLEQGIINAETSKGKKKKKPHYAYMTQEVRTMLSQRQTGEPHELLYPGPTGKIRHGVSSTYKRIVAKLGFNDGVEDDRYRVVFHTFRHTYASWLVQYGEDLYQVKERLGHGSIAQTERYSHLSPTSARNAVTTFEKILSKPTKNNNVITINQDS